MDYLNKLKTTVSNVLPGNPVTREYEIIRHVGSAGPGLLWKIYSAVKKSTRQEAAVFVFEKKLVDKYSRNDRELIIEAFKKGVSQLTRLRHPRLLTVQHSMEESRESLAFATEPVFSSLANVLGHHENVPSPIPVDLRDFRLQEVEIIYGLLQVAEGLAFLHNDVKLLHRNICLESIIISRSGAWKIGGFEFCLTSNNPADQMLSFPFKDWDMSVHPYAQPNLNYLAPECILSSSCESASDLFSLGMLIYTIFNNGKTLYDNCQSITTYRSNAQELRNLSMSTLGSLPYDLREHAKMLLNATPNLRPDADQFTKIPFFNDVGAKTLQYLDNLFQVDNLQKSQFFKGLPKIIATFPKRVSLHRVLPSLFKEAINPDMIPFVLPTILLVAENSTDDEYVQFILPDLKPIFKIQEPIQILLIFMQKMDLLLTMTPQDDIKNHVLPMVYKALEAENTQIQELCLNIIPTFACMIEYASMKNALIPRIKKLCLQTTILSVRVNCLVCIGKLLEHLDKWLVLDEILPMMPDIPSREPAVLMAMLGIYKLSMTHKKLGLTKEVMATKVLPFLFPLSIDNNLNLKQFNAYMLVVKEMLSKVEIEHRTKLEQLSSIQKEHQNLDINLDAMKDDALLNVMDNKQENNMMDSIFQGYGLGSFLQKKKPAEVLKTNSAVSPNGKPDYKSINKPAKLSLSLEEKTRLSKEQDITHRLTVQSPLQPTPTSIQTSKPVVRDLSSSLLESPSSMVNISNKSWSPSTQATTWTSSPSTWTHSSSNTWTPSPSTTSSSNFPGMNTGALSTTPLMQNSSSFNNALVPTTNSLMSMANTPKNNVVLLDNLFPSPFQRPRIPMNQLNQANSTNMSMYNKSYQSFGMGDNSVTTNAMISHQGIGTPNMMNNLYMVSPTPGMIRLPSPIINQSAVNSKGMIDDGTLMQLSVGPKSNGNVDLSDLLG